MTDFLAIASLFIGTVIMLELMYGKIPPRRLPPEQRRERIEFLCDYHHRRHGWRGGRLSTKSIRRGFKNWETLQKRYETNDANQISA